MPKFVWPKHYLFGVNVNIRLVIVAAAKLLDAVRKRNFPASIWAEQSYEANIAKLTDQEFIDEWGREF